MIIRFGFEFAVGLICFISVLILGTLGWSTFALFAFFPLVVRKSSPNGPDERELELFYKVGNFALILIIAAIILIYFASDISVNGNLVGENWHFLSISAVLLLHGLSGLLVFLRA